MPLKTKELQAAYMKEWRVANKDKVKANFQQWTEANSESRKAYMKSYLAEYSLRNDAQKARRERSLRLYRLTPETFNDLWMSQQGKCGICQIPMAPKGRTKDSVAVDHNHSTGEVRGLLCRGCNSGIGSLRDCPKVLLAAAAYLKAKGSYSESPIF